jgi:hypothetical protein
MGGPQKDLAALTDSPAKPELIQGIGLEPDRKRVNFYHARIMPRWAEAFQGDFLLPQSNWPTTRISPEMPESSVTTIP